MKKLFLSSSKLPSCNPLGITEKGFALPFLLLPSSSCRLLSSSSSSSWHGQGHLPLDQVAQNPIQPCLEHFQGWGIHNFLGNLFQCLTTFTVNNFFLISNLPSFSLKPLPLVLSLHALVNSPSPAFLEAPLQVLEYCNQVSPQPSLLRAEQHQLSQPVFIGVVLQPSDHLCGPPLDLLQQVHVFTSFVKWETQN